MDRLHLRVISLVSASDLWFDYHMECSHSRRPARLRQYPLYSKPTPPPALAEHFTPEVYAKSQAYGKDKAKFSLVSGLYKQAVDSLMLHYDAYPWAWDVAGRIIEKLGYSTEYEVNTILHIHCIR